MNLIESLYVRPPENRAQGTIVRGPYFSGDEVKPPGRPPDTSRRARILQELEEGPATRAELATATGISTDAVKHVLTRLQKDGLAVPDYVIVPAFGRQALWRKV